MEIRRIDFYVKWIGILATAICLIIGTANSYEEYQASQRQARTSDSISSVKEIVNRHLEALKPFIELRQRLYTEALNNAETIVISKDKSSQAYKTAYMRFNELYWGEMGLVEDTAVEHRMMRMKFFIDNNSINKVKIDIRGRDTTLLYLSYAMRNSLFNSWLDDTIVGIIEHHKSGHKLILKEK